MRGGRATASVTTSTSGPGTTTRDCPALHGRRPFHHRPRHRRRRGRDVQLPHRLARPQVTGKLLVAPFNLHEGILDEIDRTIKAHSAENPARIRMKMNSLLDPPSIRALYKASQAGVPIQLNVRGICALRPRVPHVSENVEVISIVGRFLEHSRIYSFERPGEEPRVYIGSADLMPRNLYNRVELVAPVEDERLRAELLDVLDRCMADNTHAWELGDDGEWTRRTPDGEPRDVQVEMIEKHIARAAEGAAH